MSEERVVFVAEAKLITREGLARLLEATNYKPVFARSKEEAMAMVHMVRESGIRLALIAANMTEGVKDGLDGIGVLRALQEQVPGIKVIVHSVQRYPWFEKMGAVMLEKSYGRQELLDVLDRLWVESEAHDAR
jgi:CheY-like chemotaxis protein